MRYDAIVLLCFYTIYFWAAYNLAKRVCHRFPLREGRLTALLCVAGASILISFGGMMMLETVTFWAEGFRLRSSHVSDRANRIPWAYVRIPLFIIGLILFWVAAALRYRAAKRGGEVHDYYLSIRPPAD
jgi:H+/Cl- antiporter ClcA